MCLKHIFLHRKSGFSKAEMHHSLTCIESLAYQLIDLECGGETQTFCYGSEQVWSLCGCHCYGCDEGQLQRC